MKWQDVGPTLLSKAGLLSSVALRRASGLAEAGWFRSYDEHASVDADGRPIPWISYPALDFLSRRLPRDAAMFEYGAGHSTLYWAGRVARVVACEHDAGWRERLGPLLPPNATVVAADPATYADAIGDGRYDVIVVDGIERPACLARAAERLTPRGIIVLDDSDRAAYEPAIAALHGFRRVDFWGMKPIVAAKSCTSVLYRDGNCLGL